MRPLVTACALALFVRALASSAAGASVEALFRSGDAATDGTRLESIERPLAAGRSGVVFRGGTAAILTRTGDTFALVARTGDPLPAPLVGTFNDFGDPVLGEGGVIAFSAGLNSPSAAGAVFLHAAGSLTAIASTSRFVADVNANGDVLMQTAAALFLWQRATGATIRLVDRRTPVPGGGRFFRFSRRAVLSDAGLVAFHAELRPSNRRPRGLFTVAAGTVPTLVMREGDPSPIAGESYARFLTRGRDPRAGLSIDAAGAVAFTARTSATARSASTAVFLQPVGGAAVTLLARAGDLVDGVPLASVTDEYAGIDSSGAVAFKGCTGTDVCLLVRAAGGALGALSGNLERRTASGVLVRAGGFAPRLTDAGGAAWRSGEDLHRLASTVVPVLSATDATPLGPGVVAGVPSIDEAGTVAFRAGREAIYLLDADGARPVASAGDAVEGAGTLRGFGTHAFGGGRLAFLGRESDGRWILVLRHQGRLRKLAASDEPTPLGGVFALEDGPLDVDAGAAVFVATVTGAPIATAVFQVRGDAPETVARAGDPAPGGGSFRDFHGVDVEGRRVVFDADLDDGSGIFLARSGRIVEVARTATPLRGLGRRRVQDLGAFAASGARVLFAADRGIDRGLFLADGGGTRRVARAGGRGRRFGFQEFGGLALGARGAAFVGLSSTDAAVEALVLVRGGRRHLLLRDGARTPEGARVDLDGATLSLLGPRVVLLATLAEGAGSRLAVLAVGP
jgi:hypothetical protein